MKVKIILPPADGRGKFSEMKLAYKGTENENYTSVLLNIDFSNIWKFTNQRNGIQFDLFLIGCYVYGIDVLLPRDVYSPNKWSREIDAEFPVESPETFENGRKELEHLLSFLTGDQWSISFVERKTTLLYDLKPNMKVFSKRERESFSKVSLFSGGLDSLIGVIDHLSCSNEKMVLVSHYDATFKGAKIDQKRIHDVLKKKLPNYHFIQTRVDVANTDTNGNKRRNETSLRSRSFLFICMATFIASSIDNDKKILIPENGTISLNHPLTASRRSSCSTRTAHPHYLRMIDSFFNKLGLNHKVVNEYELKTKGEMLSDCNNMNILLSTYKLSNSCAKRGHTRYWDDRKALQCGVCMPCIYRRVALHSIGLDDETVGTDIFNPVRRTIESIQEVSAFLDYMKTSFTISDIEKNLLINGSLPLSMTNQYAKVVFRTKEQITNWIIDKGSDEIKKLLDIL